MDDRVKTQLERRLGVLHARQRLGIESEIKPAVFRKGMNYFHPENWYSLRTILNVLLRITGLYWRCRKNTLAIKVRENTLVLPQLPAAFDGYKILHITDPHVDMYDAALHALIEVIRPLDYDLCVLTGDYRGETSGPIDASMRGMEQLSCHISQPMYAVLGNHDSIRMVPALEAAGIQLLINESVTLKKGSASLYLAGIDDAHYYRVDNIEKAASGLEDTIPSILLSHTPEVYRQAAHAGFNAMLCGHTHGGQMCLPGGYPLTIDANCPRYMAAGLWRYHKMQGYTSTGAGTSIIPARLNCPPEVVIHRLKAG
ncbi:MAG: metallophosphoesterase [Gammaproteobacteria bacterium]